MATSSQKSRQAHLDKEDVKAAVARDPETAYRALCPGLVLKPEKSGKLLRGRCPFPGHVDEHPSFTVDGPGGKNPGDWKCWTQCKAGGNVFDLAARLWNLRLPEQLCETVDRVGETIGLRPAEPEQERKVVKRQAWDLRDPAGNYVATHGRLDYNVGPKGYWYAVNGTSGLPEGMTKNSLPLYRSETVATAPAGAQIIIVEGEKSADWLAAKGYCALGTATGAGGTPDPECLQFLAGRQVILWADNDPEPKREGQAHMGRIAERLGAFGVKARIVTWAEAPEKGDCADWTGSDEDLAALIAAAVEWQAEPKARRYVDATAMADTLKRTRWLWQDWLPVGHVAILAGDSGVGKSAVALWLAGAVTGLFPWPDQTWTPEELRGPVLWCDTEGAHALFAERLVTWGIPPGHVFAPGEEGIEDVKLDQEDGLGLIEEVVRAENCRAVVIDSLATSHTKDENSADLRGFLAKLAGMARDLDFTPIVVHHLRKRAAHESMKVTQDRLRGSSAIGAVARSIIAIDQPDADDETKRLVVIKSNLAQLPEPLGFLQTDNALPEWCEAPEEPEQLKALDVACTWLERALMHGPRLRQDLLDQGKAARIAQRTLRRAAERLRCVSDTAGRQVTWRLPGPKAQGANPYE